MFAQRGKTVLKEKERLLLSGRRGLLRAPEPDEHGNEGHLLASNFLILNGTAVREDNVTTVIAFGVVGEHRVPIITGGIYDQRTLDEYGLDLRYGDRFLTAVEGFPGSFQSPIDYLAFHAEFISSGNLRVLVGDSEQSSRRVRVERIDELEDPATRAAALGRVVNFIDRARDQKYPRS